MKVGVLIPDRNDRPEFLQNCLRMMNNQTLKPEITWVMNDTPRSEAVDIGWRYKIGYERLSNRGLDVIAFIENDDWYDPQYLEIMAKKWDEVGRPLLWGTNYTIYYHLKLKKYYTMYHEQRSSAMNTFIVPNQTGIDWGPEHDPYTDLHLWTKMPNRLIWKPGRILSVGMKHGVGLCGGFAHVDYLERYINNDNGFLQNTLDEESFKFYSNLQIP